MNPNLQKLYNIAQKPIRLIVGLMSGTSFDGLDIALCRFKNSGLATEVEVLNFETVAFDAGFKEDIKSVFIKQQVSLQKVTLLNATIGLTFGNLIIKTLQKWDVDVNNVDIIASHGQTIFHAPKSQHKLKNQPNATLQIGDADHIAQITQVITLSDFRQKHVAAGGEGAPLAVYGDYLLFSKKGENRIMLNIGGIANFTFLPASGYAGEVFSTDVGPGNTLMDQYIQRHYPHKYYDKDAEIALTGTVNKTLLVELLNNPFLGLGFPKTTGPEVFNLAFVAKAMQITSTNHLAVADVLATLCQFSGLAIAQAIKKCFNTSHKPIIYLSGGGMYNPLLINILKTEVPFAQFKNTHSLSIHPDAKEAVLFALLANENICGKAIDFGDKNNIPSVCMGKISFPT
ncbi:MAG: anhydro-N-acetylmuramic acid kinase [Sphingobacteriales bacterium]|nr:MAG: anhydro-N-acetylmuramic acid kinase [Sphingobacteriales bacterium]TAF82808.1 MAG: anhydro-N-acetylmuramic acid kinase [Sphingobacteriales bacterium]